MKRPVGYFVHHQGRGHADCAREIVYALPRDQPVHIFCARPELFTRLPDNIVVEQIPSLFEPQGNEAPNLANYPTPDTLHCAPLGWPGIRLAMGRIASWFASEDPALMICDVSAEIAQLCRICSVPYVTVIQHGDRQDPGHQAAYQGAVGHIAPFAKSLAQTEWTDAFIQMTLFVGGIGKIDLPSDRRVARRRIGVADGAEVILVMSGAGGSGFNRAPLAVGARSHPNSLWITIGKIEPCWHATEPGNIVHHGWVNNVSDYLAAADLIVASPGNTTCQQILHAAKPWITIPEWRYFDEQLRKAACLQKAGLATTYPHLPSSTCAWREALTNAYEQHNPSLQSAAIERAPAQKVAIWIETLLEHIWAHPNTNEGQEAAA